jgi:hypothetical protein
MALITLTCCSDARSSMINPTVTLPAPITPGKCIITKHDTPLQQHTIVLTLVDVHRDLGLAVALGRLRRKLGGDAGAEKLAVARFHVFATDVPGGHLDSVPQAAPLSDRRSVIERPQQAWICVDRRRHRPMLDAVAQSNAVIRYQIVLRNRARSLRSSTTSPHLSRR